MPLWDQYRFGRDLLVAPVIVEGTTARDVYLPAGRWWHLFQNRWFEGGRTHRIDAPLHEIPVFLREGALLPLEFETEMRLGAATGSKPGVPRRRVALLATKRGSRVAADGLSVVVDEGGHVDVETEGDWTLVMTDAPASITVNGKVSAVSRLALGNLPLPAVASVRAVL
jgi:alpha-glucosidase (family GH31 glycosyl hydrolase)